MTTGSMRTFERPRRTLEVRLCNWGARQLKRCGLGARPLTEESILAAARRQAKLSDFGDEGFHAALGQLARSCQEDARLNPFGRLLIGNRLVSLAVNRLKMQDDLKRHPEILSERIRRPLFITGLPRTGTTLLYYLLSQDPASRPLLFWESYWPSPPPQAETRHTDPRIRRARIFVKFLYRWAPQLPTVHEILPDGPEECLTLMFNTFTSPGFSMLADVHGYEEWLRELSFEQRVAAYEDYRRQLQLLQWRCSADHWVLKTPAHLGSLDALLNVFTDGCVVHTHRDPAKAIPSLCSLFAVLRGLGTDEVDTHALGARAVEIAVELLDRATAARQDAPDRVLDVHYGDLVRDPMAAVRRIYDHFGYECTERAEACMTQWLAEDARRKRHTHRYDLEQFGLDQATIDRLFGAYCDRFGVKPE